MVCYFQRRCSFPFSCTSQAWVDEFSLGRSHTTKCLFSVGIACAVSKSTLSSLLLARLRSFSILLVSLVQPTVHEVLRAPCLLRVKSNKPLGLVGPGGILCFLLASFIMALCTSCRQSSYVSKPLPRQFLVHTFFTFQSRLHLQLSVMAADRFFTNCRTGVF